MSSIKIKLDANINKDILNKLNIDAKIRVGIFGDAESATIGAANELGTKHIPSRSFLRAPLFLAQDEIGQNVNKSLQSILFQNANPKQAMQRIALSMQNISIEAIRTSMNDTYAPLAPSTLKRRKKGKDGQPSSRPLIDTGNHILRKITTEVIIK